MKVSFVCDLPHFLFFYDIALLLAIKSITMSALYVLIGLSLLAALGFLGAFIWSIRNGQYDDDYTPSVRILFEDNNSNSKAQTK
jgi:cbb3-type cytochrome oxidase maturation protein